MSGKLLLLLKWFSFAFLFFSLIKPLVPAQPNFTLPDSIGTYINAFAVMQWFTEYQILICFLIAFYGIWILAKMVQEQSMEERRKKKNELNAKRSVALAGLPYTIRLLSNYVKASSKTLLELHDRCQGEVLPKWIDVPTLPKIDPLIFSTLKENIEFFSENAVFLSTLIASLQIQNSRMNDLAASHANPRETVSKINLESHLKDTAEISAQLELLSEFLRKEGRRLPRKIRNRDIGHALISLISDDQITIPIIDKFQLSSEDVWVPGYMKM